MATRQQQEKDGKYIMGIATILVGLFVQTIYLVASIKDTEQELKIQDQMILNEVHINKAIIDAEVKAIISEIVDLEKSGQSLSRKVDEIEHHVISVLRQQNNGQ